MAKKLFVGSLPYSATQAQIEELFAKSGTVSTCQLITDRYSGQSKGFAFVEMSSDEEADKAIKELNGYNMDGRTIVVNVAKPKEDRPPRTDGGFGGRNNGYQRNKRW